MSHQSTVDQWHDTKEHITHSAASISPACRDWFSCVINSFINWHRFLFVNRSLITEGRSRRSKPLKWSCTSFKKLANWLQENSCKLRNKIQEQIYTKKLPQRYINAGDLSRGAPLGRSVCPHIQTLAPQHPSTYNVLVNSIEYSFTLPPIKSDHNTPHLPQSARLVLPCSGFKPVKCQQYTSSLQINVL